MFKCQALSKRSKQQSKKAASNGKRVCKLHGGKSTVRVTYSGKLRCAMAKTINGRKIRSIRNKRAQKLAEMKFYFGLLCH